MPRAWLGGSVRRDVIRSWSLPRILIRNTWIAPRVFPIPLSVLTAVRFSRVTICRLFSCHRATCDYAQNETRKRADAEKHQGIGAKEAQVVEAQVVPCSCCQKTLATKSDESQTSLASAMAVPEAVSSAVGALLDSPFLDVLPPVCQVSIAHSYCYLASCCRKGVVTGMLLGIDRVSLPPVLRCSAGETPKGKRFV